MAFTTNQSAVAELYIAALGRSPEMAGLDYWVGRLESTGSDALTLTQIQAAFFDNNIAEVAARFPSGTTATQYVEAIYVNVFGRASDSEGLAFWAAKITTDGADSVMAQMLTIAKDPANSVDKAYLESKIATANAAYDAEADAGAGETGMLTESLATLKGANDAKDAWLESIPALDDDLNTATPAIEAGKVTEANVNTYFAAAANAIGTGGAAAGINITLADAVYNDLTKTALQDADIATALTKTNADLNLAVSVAKPGMTALIEAVNAEQADYEAALKTVTELTTTLAAEGAAFDSANGSGTYATVVFAADYVAATDYTGKIIISNGKAYTGGNGVALSTLTEDTLIKRVAELETANTNLVAATTAKDASLESLKDAVGAVYVLEAGGHSLADIGADGSAVTAATGAVSYIAADVDVYKTAADAALNVVTQSITFAGETGADTVTLTIDGVDVAIGASDVAADVAAAVVLAFAASTKWTVAQVGATAEVTFTAEASATNELEASDITITGDGTMAAPTVAAATETNIGDVFTVAATNANSLDGALTNLSDLEEAIANFQAARELKIALEEKNDAITEAEEAITNETDDADAPGLGLNLRDFGTQNATTGDDVFVFADDVNATVTITGFGAAGEDYLFFGQDYNLVALGDKAITTNVGSVSDLEIFWEQDGANLKLYVEAESFAGNASSTADITTIQLSGVSAEDISFADGFLTIA